MDSRLLEYKDKNVLVTGNTGFKGSWLTVWLKHLGARVYGYSIEPPTTPNMYNALNLHKQVTQRLNDIRNYPYLQGFVEMTNPEYIFHMAAQPIVAKSYKDRRETFEVNVQGTLNMVEAGLCSDTLKHLVVVTTDKVYENKPPYYYSENSPLGGDDPYGISKACAELVVRAYRDRYTEAGKTITTVRAGNVVGGGDFAIRIVPETIKSIITDKALNIWAPRSKRPWQHVLDCLYGYLLVGITETRLNEAFNFGPSEENCIPVERLVTMIIKEWGKGNYQIAEKTFYETEFLMLNPTAAEVVFGWKVKYEPKAFVQKIVEWYKAFYEKSEDMYKLTLKQIEEYENLT